MSSFGCQINHCYWQLHIQSSHKMTTNFQADHNGFKVILGNLTEYDFDWLQILVFGSDLEILF